MPHPVPRLAELIGRYRRHLLANREIIATRLAGAHSAMGLAKRADGLADFTIPLGQSPVTREQPINAGLMPLVVPDDVWASAMETGRVAALSEEASAAAADIESVKAEARAQGWAPELLERMLGDQQAARERLQGSFHRGRVDLMFRPMNGSDLQTGLIEAKPAPGHPCLSPIEVNNGGSQGHWISSVVNRVLCRGLGVASSAVWDEPQAIVTRVYEATTRSLQYLLGDDRFAQLFPRRNPPMLFLSGTYSGRMVNDIEGPALCNLVAAHYATTARYAVGFEGLELASIGEVEGRERFLVRHRDFPGEGPFVVWGELYATSSAHMFDDPATREVADAFLTGAVLGVTTWPGREVLENDKAHAVAKAQARRLERASQDAFLVDAAPATRERLVSGQANWVLKGRFGCGGSAVVVGGKAPWPGQELPWVAEDGEAREVRQLSVEALARDSGVALSLGADGRLAPESWTELWPFVVAHAQRSAGYYVAQACIDSPVFRAVLYDGATIFEQDCVADCNVCYVVSWANGQPEVLPIGALCRASPADFPTTNVTGRGGLVPVMREADFRRLCRLLGLDEVSPAG